MSTAEQMPPHERYDECDEVGCTTGIVAPAEEKLSLPDDWDVQDIQIKVDAKRVWVPLSHTTAMLLAAVLKHEGVNAETWISGRALAVASAQSSRKADE